jgi:DNA topoisomerase-1
MRIAREKLYLGICNEEVKLDKKKTNELYFTKSRKQLFKSRENPREIDYNLVNAQQARRVLDRLVGTTVACALEEKIKDGLSAGRVQSVSVRLIVERGT